MKARILFLSLLAFTMPVSRAGVVYSGLRNVPIPLDLNGVYVNPFTGATFISASNPVDWNTAPWLNPFFGGVGIGNDAILRPVITGTDQILNLGVGTVVDGTPALPASNSGSSTHVGPGPGQFLLGTPGYLGFAMQTAVASPTFYGWMQVDIENTGPGRIIDWAYQDTAGTFINVGAIPEPCTALLALAGSALLTLRRRRRSRQS